MGPLPHLLVRSSSGLGADLVQQLGGGVVVRRREQDGPDPELTAVVPTYQRAEDAAACVRALAACRGAERAEVVVVVDGSTDGTADLLAGLDVPVRLSVLEQPNRGAASARNAGAAVARGRVLLFLDDDMLAAPDLLDVLLERHGREEAVVLGHLPVAESSTPSVLLPGLRDWAAARHDRLAGGGAVGIGDWLTGQLSMPLHLFRGVGGFDEHFTAAAEFGGEDTDLLARLVADGARAVFEPRAVSAQRYTVTPAQALRQWREAGRADVRLVRKHPELLAPTRAAHRGAGAGGAALERLGGSATVRRVLLPPLTGAVQRAAAAAPGSALARHLLLGVRHLQYWAGAAEGGGLGSAAPLLVLAYHAVTDSPPERLRPWCVAPGALREQLAALAAAGATFLDPAHGIEVLRGEADAPAGSVLLTFDDGYRDLVGTVDGLLAEHGAAGLAFVVSDHVGGTNAWDATAPADELPLADWDDLRALVAAGWEVGAHTRTHPHLARCSAAQLDQELRG